MSNKFYIVEMTSAGPKFKKVSKTAYDLHKDSPNGVGLTEEEFRKAIADRSKKVSECELDENYDFKKSSNKEVKNRLKSVEVNVAKQAKTTFTTKRIIIIFVVLALAALTAHKTQDYNITIKVEKKNDLHKR